MRKIISIVLALAIMLPVGVFSEEAGTKQTSLANIAFLDGASAAVSTGMTIWKLDGNGIIKKLNQDKMNEFLTLFDQQFPLIETEDNVLTFDDFKREDTYEINFLGKGIAGSVYIQNGLVAKYGSFMSSLPNFKYKILADSESVNKLINSFYEQGEVLKTDDETSVSDTEQEEVYSGEWAEGTVTEAKKLGIVPESFGTDYAKAITREEFCNLAFNTLKRASDLELSKYQDAAEKVTLTDTQSDTMYTLYKIGIIKGKSALSPLPAENGLAPAVTLEAVELAPNDSITREEAATILNRMVAYLKVDIQPLGEFKYADSEEFPDWAAAGIYNMLALNIMQGTGNNEFDPNGSYTRDQAIATMMRIFDKTRNGTETTFADSLNHLMPTDKNYMFSPFCIKMALAMAANGADGATRDEILKVLKIEDLEKFNQLSTQLIKEYSENKDVQLNIANALWLNTDYDNNVDFEASFKDTVANNYDADSEKVNNTNAVETVNNWVKNKTNGKITDLISDSEFLAYIVNAIYFKGEWAVQFKEAATKKAEFTDRNSKKTEIDFMNMTNYFDYYEDSHGQMLKLPYKDGKTSMYIAISTDRKTDLENNIEKMERKRVQVSLPKFKTEFNIKLMDTLSQLGIQTAFDPKKADFKKMFTDTPDNIFISDVIHKTFINVDESGTEAAAVTGIGFSATSAPMDEPVIFNANKPFTYFIRDDVNGEILFMGEYAYAE